MLMEDHLDDFGRIISQENGKTFAEARPKCAGQSRMSKSPAHPDDDARLQPRRRGRGIDEMMIRQPLASWPRSLRSIFPG